MWSNYKGFMILSDGKERIILLTETHDGEQQAFIFNNPILTQMGVDHTADRIEVTTLNDLSFEKHWKRQFIPGMYTTTVNLTFEVGGNTEIERGRKLAKKFDPVFSKTVLELMKVVNQKLNEREEPDGK